MTTHAKGSDFWGEVDMLAISGASFCDNKNLYNLPPIPRQVPFLARHTYLHQPPTADLSRKRPLSKITGTSGPARSAAKKTRKSSGADSRNTLRAPPVASADALKVKKYPMEHKERVDAALRTAGVHFAVPASVQTFVARPATKDMGKYWYVLWNTVFALLEREPARLLPRAAEHIALLYRAQSAVSPLVHDAASRAPNETGRETASASAEREKEKMVSLDKFDAAQQASVFAKPVDCAALFRTAARRDVPHYSVDSDVVAALNKVLCAERDAAHAKAQHDSNLLLSLHETCWAFIYGIAERLGDMFLSRACLDRNALQLGLAQRAYWQECARAAGVQCSAAHAPIVAMDIGKATSNDAAPSPMRVAALRDLLFHAFERLSVRAASSST